MVLNLCQKLCPEKIPSHINLERLGDGADGEVFALENDPEKVIKFCVLYEKNDQKLHSAYGCISSTISYLIKELPLSYARVYSQMYLGEWSRSIVWGNTQREQKYILYYYTMEKLSKISHDEVKVFHTILSHEDREIKKNFSNGKLKEILAGLQKGLDFDAKRVIFFCDMLQKTNVQHLDLHPRNIMKDDCGNYKVIDFDRLQMGDKNAEERHNKS